MAIEAISEECVGSIEDIDVGVKLGCNHPMGPFTLLDFEGIETTYYTAEILQFGVRPLAAAFACRACSRRCRKQASDEPKRQQAAALQKGD